MPALPTRVASHFSNSGTLPGLHPKRLRRGFPSYRKSPQRGDRLTSPANPLKLKGESNVTFVLTNVISHQIAGATADYAPTRKINWWGLLRRRAMSAGIMMPYPLTVLPTGSVPVAPGLAIPALLTPSPPLLTFYCSISSPTILPILA